MSQLDNMKDPDTDLSWKRSTLEVRTDLFNADVWTVPFFSFLRQHWFLGVVNFRCHQLQYLDSLPVRSTNPIHSHGPEFVFSVSDASG